MLKVSFRLASICSIIIGVLLSISANIRTALAQTEPLPTRTNVPDDFSMVHCPTEAATRTMLRDYHVKDSDWIDISMFFKGLKATGCQQLSRPVTIGEVVERKSFREGPSGIHVALRSVGSGGGLSGREIFDIVHEFGDDQHPRAPLDRWKQTHAPDGVLTATPQHKRVYVCPTSKAAMNVIATIPAAGKKGLRLPKQLWVKVAAIKANRCSWATGPYRAFVLTKCFGHKRSLPPMLHLCTE
jgi:hypothetical protein